MMYVRVLVADPSFHGKEALTYESPKKLAVGTLVTVPLKDKLTTGVVIGYDKKPRFNVRAVIEASALDPLPRPLLQLLEWMPTYYPAPLGVITQQFLPRKLVARQPDNVDVSNEFASTPSKPLPQLTAAQKAALEKIEGPGLHLLHGETGSGKTRVYIELAKKSLAEGRSVIALSPEIGLTSHLANEFSRALGQEKVVVFHSQLTQTRRQTAWQRVLTTKEPLIIVGARSALFLPTATLGLIIIDESHETAYKQDSAPHYHTNTVAAKLAALHRASLILGSATPSVTDYFIAKAKKRPIIYMGETAKKSSAVAIKVIDKRSKSLFTKSPYLSDELLQQMRDTLNKNEQSLVFLNRRGTARVVLCENCGWQSLCPHCDLPLTYHADSHRVICHTCSYRQASPASCPDCGNASILFKSIGTKAVVDQLVKLFPDAKIQRFDTDNTKAERLESHYESIKSGNTDILVGTQTLAKGLDLPKLGFVGVIDAETSLSFPDFSATERSYQLLAQVLGRVGRGHREARAVIQTYSPANAVLKNAVNKNWRAFYENELEERKVFNFPPFCYLLKITCKRSSANAAEKASQKFCESLQSFPGITIDGPAPSFHEKQEGKFQWQIVVKSRSRETLLRVISTIPTNFSYDIDPVNLL